MAIPSRRDMRVPLLQHLADGETHYWQTVKEAMADHFVLTVSDRQLLHRLGNNLFDSKLFTVLNHLWSEGMVELAKESYYSITDTYPSSENLWIQHCNRTIFDWKGMAF